MTKLVKRRFQSYLFAKFSWLEYSVQQDATYCFCWRYRSKESSPFAEPTEFSDWQHATGEKYELTLHSGSCVWTGADEGVKIVVHTLELHLYLFFLLILFITSMFLYYACKGPSRKYVMLFLSNFDPLPHPCHTLSHIPGPRQKYVTHLGFPPNF